MTEATSAELTLTYVLMLPEVLQTSLWSVPAFSFGHASIKQIKRKRFFKFQIYPPMVGYKSISRIQTIAVSCHRILWHPVVPKPKLHSETKLYWMSQA